MHGLMREGRREPVLYSTQPSHQTAGKCKDQDLTPIFADEALYAAKRAGRDRMRNHTAAEPESPRYS